MTKRGVHDLGGLPAGPIDTHDHEPTMVERRIDALMMLMRDPKRRFWKTDENRRTIESMTPQIYEGSGYYKRWVCAMRSLLVEKGVLTLEEIEQRLAEVRARHEPPVVAAQPKLKAKTKKSPTAPAKRQAATADRVRAGVRVRGEPERGGSGGSR